MSEEKRKEFLSSLGNTRYDDGNVAFAAMHSSITTRTDNEKLIQDTRKFTQREVPETADPGNVLAGAIHASNETRRIVANRNKESKESMR